MLITGVQIPAAEGSLIRRVDFEEGDIVAMQGFVGGYFEAMDLDEPDATMWCNEEALLMNAPVNRMATLMLWVHNQAHRGHTTIRGDVLITGRLDEDRELDDIPQELLELMFFHTSCKYEMKLAGDNNWWDNHKRFSHWSEAYEDVLKLVAEWPVVSEFRVLPA